MAERLVIGIVGACVGVLGWLLVGMFIQRRDFIRRAKDAGRAVYFELGANHLAIFAAHEHASFGQLSRATFDRLLPELSTWMTPLDLQKVVFAYFGQSTYEQLITEDISPETRQLVLKELMASHHEALDALRLTAFRAGHASQLESSGEALFERHARLAAAVYGSDGDAVVEAERAAHMHRTAVTNGDSAQRP